VKRQLTQQEIDSFFNAATDPNVSADAGAAPFDFRRLDRIPKSQVNSIHFLHETFVRNLSSSLTVYLRSFISGSLISVEQLPYTDFVEALAMPTCLVYLTLDPYEGHALLEVSPSLIASILDLVLGGNGKFATELTREITEVERNLLEGFFQIITRDLRETWNPVVAVAFETNSIETSVQLSGRFVPTEAVVTIAMEFRIGQNTGMMNLAIPCITLKTMRQKFEQQWTSHKAENLATELAIKRKLAQSLEVTVDCEQSGATIALKDLLNLSVGSILTLAPGFDKSVDVLVNGIPKFKGLLTEGDNEGRAVVVE